MTNKLKDEIKKMKSSLELPKKAKDALITAGIVLSGAVVGGVTANQLKSEENKKQLFELLQPRGVESLEDINTPNILGQTPLMGALSAKEAEVLLALGADPAAKSEDGHNAIYYALKYRVMLDVDEKDKAPIVSRDKSSAIQATKSNDIEVKGSNFSTQVYAEYDSRLVTSNAFKLNKQEPSKEKDVIKQVALLMKAGTPIEISGLFENSNDEYLKDVDAYKKKILTEAGKIAGKEKEVEEAIKIAEKAPAEVYKGRYKEESRFSFTPEPIMKMMTKKKEKSGGK